MSKDNYPERIRTWGVIPFGSSHLQVRHIVLWVGFAVWFLVTLYGAQIQAITSLAFNLTFLIGVILASWATRTVSLQKVAICFFGGGFMVSIVSLAAIGLNPTLPYAHLRNVVMVMLVETAKLVPLIFMLLRGRKFSTWTLGATDLILMGAACGTGYAFAVDAYTHKLNPAFEHFFVLIPTSEIVNGRLSSGEAIWTSLVAGTIGLGLLFRYVRPMALLAIPIGLAISIMDHFGLYYTQMPDTSGWVVSGLNFLTVYGYLGFVLFCIVLAACIGADFYVLASSLPKLKELKYFSRKDRKESLDMLWDSILDLRKLSFAYFRYKRAKNAPADLAVTVAILAKRLVNRAHDLEPVSVTVVGSIDGAGLTLNLKDMGKSITFAPENLADSSPRHKKPKNPYEGQLPVAEMLQLPPRYQLLQEGATGGMGIIYKGLDSQTGEVIAIKVMHPQHSANKLAVRRFEQEAKASMTLEHPNIVMVRDFGITDRSIAYLIMEWIDGQDLGVTLEELGRLPLDSFLDIFSQAASALAHSHSKGVIHRDVKPSNLILSPKGRDYLVKIVDFGIAKVVSPEASEEMNLTQTGELVGSPMFMSPEQCNGKPLDNRSDIYSLGCVMYNALVGEPPLIADNPAKLFFKQMFEMPARPTTLFPQLEMPQIMEPLLFKALQKDPASRYPSMADLENELRRVQALLGSAKNC